MEIPKAVYDPSAPIPFLETLLAQLAPDLHSVWKKVVSVDVEFAYDLEIVTTTASFLGPGATNPVTLTDTILLAILMNVSESTRYHPPADVVAEAAPHISFWGSDSRPNHSLGALMSLRFAPETAVGTYDRDEEYVDTSGGTPGVVAHNITHEDLDDDLGLYVSGRRQSDETVFDDGGGAAGLRADRLGNYDVLLQTTPAPLGDIGLTAVYGDWKGLAEGATVVITFSDVTTIGTTTTTINSTLTITTNI